MRTFDELPDWVKNIIRSPKFKKAHKEGIADIKAGRTKTWKRVRKEMEL